MGMFTLFVILVIVRGIFVLAGSIRAAVTALLRKRDAVVVGMTTVLCPPPDAASVGEKKEGYWGEDNGDEARKA